MYSETYDVCHEKRTGWLHRIYNSANRRLSDYVFPER